VTNDTNQMICLCKICGFKWHGSEQGPVADEAFNIQYTGWFRRKCQYFGRWYYWSLWDKSSQGHFL